MEVNLGSLVEKIKLDRIEGLFCLQVSWFERTDTFIGFAFYVSNLGNSLPG